MYGSPEPITAYSSHLDITILANIYIYGGYSHAYPIQIAGSRGYVADQVAIISSLSWIARNVGWILLNSEVTQQYQWQCECNHEALRVECDDRSYVHILAAIKYYYELRCLSLSRVFVNTRTSSSFVILKPSDVLPFSNSGFKSNVG